MAANEEIQKPEEEGGKKEEAFNISWLKIMLPEGAEAIGHDRFLREIATAAQLNHPHILPLHDSGAQEDQLYYVMPYVIGGTLRDRLKNEKQLPIEEALRITKEIASALAHAHSQGLVHRDIKPEIEVRHRPRLLTDNVHL